MKRSIWKLAIPNPLVEFEDEQGVTRFDLEAPSVARPLFLETRDGETNLWVEVELDSPKRLNRMVVVGTGQEIPDDAFMFIGSWRDGRFMWHLYHCFDEGDEIRRDQLYRPGLKI